MKETNILEVLNRLIDNIRYSKIKYEYEMKMKQIDNKSKILNNN